MLLNFPVAKWLPIHILGLSLFSEFQFYNSIYVSGLFFLAISCLPVTPWQLPTSKTNVTVFWLHPTPALEPSGSLRVSSSFPGEQANPSPCIVHQVLMATVASLGSLHAGLLHWDLWAWATAVSLTHYSSTSWSKAYLDIVVKRWPFIIYSPWHLTHMDLVFLFACFFLQLQTHTEANNVSKLKFGFEYSGDNAYQGKHSTWLIQVLLSSGPPPWLLSTLGSFSWRNTSPFLLSVPISPAVQLWFHLPGLYNPK